jgi:branched-chain amino acid transport system ATP-binding protein
MSVALEIGGLSAGYDAPAVRDVTLSVDTGSVVAILGPNGAGKTTTLLAVSGIARVFGGEIKAFGRSVLGMEPQQVARLGIAHVPEGRALFPSLTVGEHLKIVPGQRKARRQRIEAMMELFPELAPIISRRASLLSGGEQQMVALARALLSQPRVMMIDEMSLGLAPLVVQRLLAAVRKVATETGCAVLLVEQHVQLAVGIADQVCVLSRGTVRLKGDAEDFNGRHELIEAAYMGQDAEAPK